MNAPCARTFRNRRRLFLYSPLLILGALAVLAAFPTFNSAYVLGVIFLAAGAAGFVLETGNQK
ncbi:hypothetical protein [Arthrobacter sp. UYCu712]|uniref:hypothetical protein n=1 Tax=Arthrobacter sp. UYCu712 TaxID=3156340 RepID=UPI0033917D95